MQSDIYNQEATYWASLPMDGYGERSFAAPVLIKCRWEDRTGLRIQKEDEVVESRAIVYPQVDIAKGGYLYLGDGTATADPQDLDDAYMIQDYRTVPSVNGKITLRKAIL